MDGVIENIAKSTQEQAVASWINQLNQIRLDKLFEDLKNQDLNLEKALKELKELKLFLLEPEHILGNINTKHGEIAEHVQVNIENARRLIEGMKANHTFENVERLAPEDYIRNGHQVQSKFYNELGKTFFGKNALKDHLNKYPDFIKNGGQYDIPRDQFNELEEIMDKYYNNRSQLSTSDFSTAKQIDLFLKANNLKLNKDIKPSVAEYKDVQVNTVDKTVCREENDILDTDKKRRETSYVKSKPTLDEGLKAMKVGAAAEGGIGFCLAVSRKRKEKNFNEFTVDDWKDIGIETGKDTVKGGIRGGTIYVLSNFIQMPAAVASGYVTATFGVISQLNQLEKGSISNEDFLTNCETLCLDVTVSSISSVMGQALIPIPILGAVIGNVTGEVIYELCKKYGSDKSDMLIAEYKHSLDELNKKLDQQYKNVVDEINTSLKKYKDIEEFAFDEDVNQAFYGSIHLALEIGVPKDKILKTTDEIDTFFMG